jgi:threonine/homoserine/homoserine lactone efflux protein
MAKTAIFIVVRAILSCGLFDGIFMDPFIIALKGLMVGFAIAAPVGPIAFLCIRTTIKNGPVAGLSVGAGAAVADTFYAILGVFSLAMVKSFVTAYALPLRIAGGLFLLALGLMTIFSHSEREKPAQVSGATLLKNFTGTFFLTMTNPATIFAFIAAFTALGFTLHDPVSAGIMVGGVFAGSMLWWTILSASVYGIKSKISEQTLHRVNIAAGAIIVIFGLVALISAYWLL